MDFELKFEAKFKVLSSKYFYGVSYLGQENLDLDKNPKKLVSAENGTFMLIFMGFILC